MNVAFAYHGGKARLADQISAVLPAHKVYVEPFAGSLAVLLAKPRSNIEMVNDLDGELVNFWQQLRDHPEEMQRLCWSTPYARAEYDAAWEPTEEPLERARRFWVRVQQGVAHKIGSKSGWQCSASDGRGSTAKSSTVARKVDALLQVAERIRDVMIDCRPATDVIRMMDSPQALHYCDPPYVPSTFSTAGSNPYAHMMSEDDHRELATTLHATDGAAVVSGYPSALYDDLYGDWHRVELVGRADTANRRGGTNKRVEVLWSNRPLSMTSQPTLYGQEATA